MVETYSLQDQLQVESVLKQVRWGGTVGGAIGVTFDNIQLASGFVQPVLEVTKCRLDFIDQSFLLALRERLREIGAGIWLEDAWTPRVQRENDRSIMEVFCEMVPGRRHAGNLKNVTRYACT